MLSLLSKFQKISPYSFLSRGRFIPILVLFLKISPKNMLAFVEQKINSMTYSFCHHDLSPYAMLRLLRKFQKISPCSFLSRGRFIPFLAHFLKSFVQEYGGLHCAKFNSMTSFSIINYLRMLC